MLAAAACAAVSRQAAGEGAKYPRNLTSEDVDRWMTELSNWEKWGQDDQAGTINLELLSAAAAERRRWTYLLTINPLRVPGATGGPVNPIATF
jgi:hypothetical protein